MRRMILILLALSIAALFGLYPEIAAAMMRIEAFGWLIEIRQSLLLTGLLFVLAITWAIRIITQRTLAIAVSGPGHFWNLLRAGSAGRRNKNLRAIIADMIDGRTLKNTKALHKAHGIIPDWSLPLLKSLQAKATDIRVPSHDDDELDIALRARLASDPHASPRPDLITRKAFLEAWRKVSPESPLLLQRSIELAEEEQDWTRAVSFLEDSWQRGQRSAIGVRDRLCHAYLQLAQQSDKRCLEVLRKAQRLMPENHEIIWELGQYYLHTDSQNKAINLWHQYLEQYNDLKIAKALLAILKDKPLASYRKWEKKNPSQLNKAALWLRAELAHAAELHGLARDSMHELLQKHPDFEPAWHSLGQWHAAAQEWQDACKAYAHLNPKGLS